MKVALFGCGHWGSVVAKNLHENQNLASVFDTNMERATALARKFGVPVRSVEESTAKVCYVAIPHGMREPTISKAIENFDRVILEKPAHNQIFSLKRIYELAEAHQTEIFIGHLLRHSPCVQFISSYLKEIGLSKLREIHCTRISKKRDYTEQDIVLDFVVHDFSIVQEVLGPISPFACSGEMRSTSEFEFDANVVFPCIQGCKVTISCVSRDGNKERSQVYVFDGGKIKYDEISKSINAQISCPYAIQTWAEMFMEWKISREKDALSRMISAILNNEIDYGKAKRDDFDIYQAISSLKEKS